MKTLAVLFGFLLCCYLQNCGECSRPSVDLRNVIDSDEPGVEREREGPFLQYCKNTYRYQTYRLTCKVQGDYVAFLWTKDDVPLFNQTKNKQTTRKNGDYTTFKMTIVDLEPTDAGTYKLMVADNQGTSEKAFRITDTRRRGPKVDLRNIVDEDVGEVENQEPRVGPSLQFCMGKFMDLSYMLTCMITEDYTSLMWTMNDMPLFNQTKYKQTTSKYGNMIAFTLTIMNLNATDVGNYKLMVGNSNGTSEETFWVTDVEACSSHMKCFENPCAWPRKLSCKSRPEAHCVVDMCRQPTMCEPVWFVDLQEVTCDEVDDGGDGNGGAVIGF